MSNERITKNTNWKVKCERMTTDKRNKSQDGDNPIIFNTDTNNYEGWNGSEWISLTSPGSGISGALSLEDLFEVENDLNGDIIKIIAKYDLQVPPESIEIGESIKVSDLAQVIGYTTKYNEKRFLLVDYEITDNGSEIPLIKVLDEPSGFILQPVSEDTLTFNTPKSFNILSQQANIGELYNLKMYSDSDIAFKVFRMPENGGEKTLLVDEVLKQETLDINGSLLKLSPVVDFEANKLYELLISSDSDITMKGIETTSTAFSSEGIGVVSETTFIPYIERLVGWTYTEKEIALKEEISQSNGGNAIAEFFHYSFKTGFDNDAFFDDGLIRLSWDTDGNDLELYMLTEPSNTGDLVALATKGNGSTVSTYITQTNYKYDILPTGVNPTELLVLWVSAEEDETYPTYQVKLHNAGSVYNSTVEVKKIIPKI